MIFWRMIYVWVYGGGGEVEGGGGGSSQICYVTVGGGPDVVVTDCYKGKEGV